MNRKAIRLVVVLVVIVAASVFAGLHTKNQALAHPAGIVLMQDRLPPDSQIMLDKAIDEEEGSHPLAPPSDVKQRCCGNQNQQTG